MTIALELPIQRALVERAVHLDGYEVHIMTERTPSQVSIMRPLSPPTIQTCETGSLIPDRQPAFILTHQSAQALLDALWSAGIRPSSGQGAADVGVVKAMQAHIDDLRVAAGLKPKSADQPSHPESGRF